MQATGVADSQRRWLATWTRVEAAGGADAWEATGGAETWVAVTTVQRRRRDAEVAAAGVWPMRRGVGGGFGERE